MNDVNEDGEVETLERQLELDERATLRDLYLDRLHLAAREIAVALDAETPERIAILKELGEAVRIGESVLNDVWDSHHGIGGRAARLPIRE